MAEVIDVVNDDYQNTLHTIMDGCVSEWNAVDAQDAMSISPNPVTGSSIVKFPFGSWTMDIMDIQGRITESREVSGRRAMIAGEALVPGSYIVQLSNEQGRLVSRFEVQ